MGGLPLWGASLQMPLPSFASNILAQMELPDLCRGARVSATPELGESEG